MTAAVLFWSVAAAQLMIVAAMGCYAYRVVRGPRAQDRILSLDALYVNAMLVLVIFGMKTGTTTYFEIALIIGLLGFVGTVALAKFLMRGEVIE